MFNIAPTDKRCCHTMAKVPNFALALALTMLITASLDAQAQGKERSSKEVVDSVCSKCHATGAKGAPKIGDRDAWIPRLKEGLDSTVRSAMKGHGGMPARGGLADLSDSELRSAVIYLFRGTPTPAK